METVKKFVLDFFEILQNQFPSVHAKYMEMPEISGHYIWVPKEIYEDVKFKAISRNIRREFKNKFEASLSFLTEESLLKIDNPLLEIGGKAVSHSLFVPMLEDYQVSSSFSKSLEDLPPIAIFAVALIIASVVNKNEWNDEKSSIQFWEPADLGSEDWDLKGMNFGDFEANLTLENQPVFRILSTEEASLPNRILELAA